MKTCLALIAILGTSAPANAELFARVLSSKAQGPTLVVVGVEGLDGSAGVHAVRQLQWNRPDRGTLVLVQSRAPFSSTTVAKGWTAVESVSELEKRFPDSTRVILRESYEMASASPKASGATVTGAGMAAKTVLDTLRELPVGSGKGWQLLHEENRNGRLIVTTCSKNARKEQRPSIRQFEQRVAVRTLMQHLGMATDVAAHRVFPTENQDRICVAIYDDLGSISSSGHGPAWLRSELAGSTDLLVELVGRTEVVAGALNDADVLVVGGGYSNQQGSGLGEIGRSAIKSFVRRGGGYLGICAGAFLACQSSSKRQYLDLLPVKTQGNSGSVVTTLDWSHSPVGPAREEKAKFSGGPTFIPQDQGSKLQVWATYRENPQVGSKRLTLKNTAAILSGQYGKGRVVVFGPHCERRPSDSKLFSATVRSVAASRSSRSR